MTSTGLVKIIFVKQKQLLLVRVLLIQKPRRSSKFSFYPNSQLKLCFLYFQHFHILPISHILPLPISILMRGDTLSLLFTIVPITHFFKRFYLFMTDRERQRHRQREKQALCREPDVGLDPWTPGSCPGLQAVLNPLSHPGCLLRVFIMNGCCTLSDAFSERNDPNFKYSDWKETLVVLLSQCCTS